MKLYCALIGDIIDSRQIETRSETQSKLKKALNDVDQKYSKDIASRFTVTLGDEFQGLLIRPNHVLDIIDDIVMEMYPVRIRFGIGIGEMSTDIDPLISIGADGPAYYNAREMIYKLRNEEKGRGNPEGYIKFSAGEHNNHFEEDLMNSTLALYTFIEKKWTEPQRNKIYEYIKYEGTQRDISRRLDVNVSSVNRGLNTAGFYNYRYAKKTMQNYLAEQWDKLNV